MKADGIYRALEAAGNLEMRELRLLCLLAARGPLHVTEAAECLGLTPQQLGRTAVPRLLDLGLLQRLPADDGDLRIVRLALTPRGAAGYNRMLKLLSSETAIPA